MKNITITVDDDLYRRARIVAAQNETSLTALVRNYLESLAQKTEAAPWNWRKEILKTAFARLDQRLRTHAPLGKFNRDEIYAGRLKLH